jgi:ribosomal protein L29
MTPDDIRQRLNELLDNPLKIRAGRREIAKLLTVLREKEGQAV